MRRRVARAIACMLTGALLLAQAAVASYACPSMNGDERVVSASESPVPSSEEDATMDLGALDVNAPSLCAEHCKAGQQTDRTATVALPLAVPVLLYLAPAPPLALLRCPPRLTWSSAMVAAAPPHAILHCVRRT